MLRLCQSGGERAQATLVSDPSLASDASNLDPYGNPLGAAFGVTYVGNDPGWKQDAGELAGARYIQVRLTLVSDAATAVVPELSAMGLAFYR